MRSPTSTMILQCSSLMTLVVYRN